MPLLPDLFTADQTFSPGYVFSAGHALAITLAVVGAALLAVGTHTQHTAVQRTPVSTPGRVAVLRLLTVPLWLLGGVLIVLETVFNVVALALAPAALIQPLGTVSLAVAVLIGVYSSQTAAAHKRRDAAASGTDRSTIRSAVGAVVLVITSVTLFVGTASQHMETSPVSDTAAAVLAGGMLALSAVGVVVARSRAGHMSRVIVAGVLFGSVASGAHVVGMLLLAGEGLPSAVWTVAAALAPASAVGIWLVQTAYAGGSAESVLAGLTVVDPITAVMIGGLLLGEFGTIPPASVMLLVISGTGALWGVKLLAPHRPGTPPTPASPAVSAPADNMGGARGEGVPAHS